jgi:hypothetical protein
MNKNIDKVVETDDQLLAVDDEAHADEDDDDMNERDIILASSNDNEDGGNNKINDKSHTTDVTAEMVTELVNCLALLLIEMDTSIAAVHEDGDDGKYATMTLGQKRKRTTNSSSNSNKSLHYTPTIIQHKAMDNNDNNDDEYENVRNLLQEGYSLLLTMLTTTERNIILSSLIKQLRSTVKTSYCRHLLLIDIIPHFIHLLPNTTTATRHNTPTNNSHQDNSSQDNYIMDGLPDWLIDDNHEYKDSTTTTATTNDHIRNNSRVGRSVTTTTMVNDTNNKSNISNSNNRSIHEEEEEEIQQLLLQAFAMIIHDDITIIPPFLSLLSNLFTATPANYDENEQITSLMMLLADTNGEEENCSAHDLGGVVDNDKDDTDDDDDDDASKKSSSCNNSNASTTTTSSIKNVREFCFHLCLSVLSNIHYQRIKLLLLHDNNKCNKWKMICHVYYIVYFLY